MKCTACGSALEPTSDRCPGCGGEVELGRLTGILGRVCRACDVYSEPGARTCAGCGQPLAPPAEPSGGPAALADAGRGGEPQAGRAPVVHYAGHGGSDRGARASPASAARPALTLERGAGVRGATFRLDPGAAPAGRAPGPLSFPGDPALAPHHATFLWRDGALRLLDQGAPGGSFLRLRADEVATLAPGDAFLVGDRVLRYAGPLPPPAPPPPDGTRRLGAPRPSAPAVVLEELLEGGGPGRVHVRGGPVVVVGRGGAGVALDDPGVASSHAELRIEPDGSVRLRDLGSAGGTFVRLPPRGEQPLGDGDVVRIGREVLRVALPLP